MNRAQLEGALRVLSQSHGYSFSSLPAHRLAEVKRLPAVVLEPPTVDKVEGRGHGRITYNVTLHILSLAAKLSAEERSLALQQMESDVLAIFAALSENERVIVVDGLGITPQEFVLTTHGDISQTARAKVVTHF